MHRDMGENEKGIESLFLYLSFKLFKNTIIGIRYGAMQKEEEFIIISCVSLFTLQ